MITTRLQGGLGNQMFQMATAYAHSKRLNTECAFDFNGCHTPLQGNTSVKYKDNFFKNFKEMSKFPEVMVNWNEGPFNYSPIPLDIGNDIILNGYYQSVKYFEDYSDDIKMLFHFPYEIKNKVCEWTFSNFDNFTSVHVRRGDYISSPHMSEFHTNLCKTDYYQKAMEMIGGNFVFISDDIEWCKKVFKGDNIFYSPFTSELEDLYLMTYCTNNIIANSSFSWWGAYLGPDGKIIAPNNWFGPLGPKDTQDLIPNNWIKI